jgi:hypothetical protein
MRNYLLSNTLEVGITRDNSLICLSFKRRMQSWYYELFGINQQSHMTVVIFGKKNLPSFHTAFNANKIRAEAPKSSNESCSGNTRKRWVRS